MRGGLTEVARRQVAAAAEAQAPADELLAGAIAADRWPARRFRVEGTPFGNSRLMRAVDAELARRRYGGSVVEVIPARDAWRREARKQEGRR